MHTELPTISGASILLDDKHGDFFVNNLLSKDAIVSFLTDT